MKRAIARRVNELFARKDSKSIVHQTARLNRFVVLKDTSVGRYSYLGPRSRADNTDIGSFCSISWDCFLGLDSHDTDRISTSPIFTERLNGTSASWIGSDILDDAPRDRTVIGHDVWIGVGSRIMQGVTIGDGAVVAAGSIVTKNVAPYSIVGGVPARHIAYRFSEDIVVALEKKRWWDAADADIRSRIDLFQKRPITLDDIDRLPQGK